MRGLGAIYKTQIDILLYQCASLLLFTPVASLAAYIEGTAISRSLTTQVIESQICQEVAVCKALSLKALLLTILNTLKYCNDFLHLKNLKRQ